MTLVYKKYNYLYKCLFNKIWLPRMKRLETFSLAENVFSSAFLLAYYHLSFSLCGYLFCLALWFSLTLGYVFDIHALEE